MSRGHVRRIGMVWQVLGLIVTVGLTCLSKGAYWWATTSQRISKSCAEKFLEEQADTDVSDPSQRWALLGIYIADEESAARFWERVAQVTRVVFWVGLGAACIQLFFIV